MSRRCAIRPTKHNQRRCTTCRDYARHQKAQRGPGNWVAKLGTIHLAHAIGAPKFFCGRDRKTGMLWALRGSLSTCRACKRCAAL